MLDSKLDLVAGGLTAGIASYHNTAASPEALRAAIGPSPDDGASTLTRVLLAVQIALWVVALVGIARLSTGETRRRQSDQGPV